MDAASSPLLDTLLAITPWTWILMCGLLALAGLVVAGVCTIRRQNLAAGWLMFLGFCGMFVFVSADIALWRIHAVDVEIRQAVSMAVSLAQLCSEALAVGSVLLFRPWQSPVAEPEDRP